MSHLRKALDQALGSEGVAAALLASAHLEFLGVADFSWFMRLLIVEDNEVIAELLARELRAAGFDVDLVTTEADARASRDPAASPWSASASSLGSARSAAGWRRHRRSRRSRSQST